MKSNPTAYSAPAALGKILAAAAAAFLIGGCATQGDQSDVYSEAAGVQDDPASTGYIVAQIDDLTVVDCLLPGKLRKMGQTVTWVTRPRPVKKTVSDCEILGGQYVLFDRANYDTALAVWMLAAKEGDPTAQTYVGEIYERGLGRAPNYAEAAVWYRKAADQGFARAQLRLGALREKGLGVPKDRVDALNLYRQAAGIPGDRLTYLSQAVAGSQKAPRGRGATSSGGSSGRPSATPPSAAPAPQGRVAAEIAAIEAETRAQDAKLNRTEQAVAQAKEQIIIQSRKSRLIEQTAPSVQPQRRLIDQYVALTEEAENQRIARDGLKKVLEVGSPVVAQR
jgi:hypothetical protein